MLSKTARQMSRNDVAVNVSLFPGQNTIADTALPAISAMTTFRTSYRPGPVDTRAVASTEVQTPIEDTVFHNNNCTACKVTIISYHIDHFYSAPIITS